MSLHGVKLPPRLCNDGPDRRLFQPENVEGIVQTNGEQLEVPCYPDMENLSWDLSGGLEKLLEAGQ